MSEVSELGQWGAVLAFPNVPIHVHVLPNGRVLMWGRRDHPDDGMNPHFCTPFEWDPADPVDDHDPTVAKTVPTAQPTLQDGTRVNLFCGGHAFLADGRLLTVGGHLTDGNGVNQANVFDASGQAAVGHWTPTGQMLHGRWYPTATTLPDGGVLVLAGSYMEDNHSPVFHNREPQVWKAGQWRTLTGFPGEMLDLYPRAHVASDGRVFLSGPLQTSWYLDSRDPGVWEETPARRDGQFDYAPAVLYDTDKIAYFGGGGGAGGVLPSADIATIDLTAEPLAWRSFGTMHVGRRQHNATLLPDGTILITGGSRGSGFNNLDPGQPVHDAELWDPATGQSTILAVESVDRCYHSTAVLLPDATVLSAGGGEFGTGDDPRESHLNGQVFSPPYLFRGPRPRISAAPHTPIDYGEQFTLTTPDAAAITRVSLIRLSSTTHAFNQSQRINVLDFTTTGDQLSITAPATSALCPPGPHMLFILDSAGVPSVASIVQVGREAADADDVLHQVDVGATTPSHVARFAARTARRQAPQGRPVRIGIRSTCPYGLDTCWGGAFEALSALPGVAEVNHVAGADSTAEVWLTGNGLPPIDQWRQQFALAVNGRYEWVGVDVSLTGRTTAHGTDLTISAESVDDVVLTTYSPADVVEWDPSRDGARQPRADELDAYDRLRATVSHAAAPVEVTVDGTLGDAAGSVTVAVRHFAVGGQTI